MHVAPIIAGSREDWVYAALPRKWGGCFHIEPMSQAKMKEDSLC